MKFLIAIVILLGLNFGLSYAKNSSLLNQVSSPTNNQQSPVNTNRDRSIAPTPQPLPPNQIPPQKLDCLMPGEPVRPENPKLLPCPPTTPGTIPPANGVDPNIPTKADLSR